MGVSKAASKVPEDIQPPSIEKVCEIVEYYPQLHKDGWDDLPFQHLKVNERLPAMKKSRDFMRFHCYNEVCASLILFQRFGRQRNFNPEGIQERSLVTIYSVMAKDDNLPVPYVSPGSIVVASEYLKANWRVNVETFRFEFAMMIRWYCEWEHWYVTRGLMEYTRPRFYKRHRNEFY